MKAETLAIAVAFVGAIGAFAGATAWLIRHQ
jgi:hypothetical protein